MKNLLTPKVEALRPAVARLGVGAFAVVNNVRRRPMFRSIHRQDPSRFEPVGIVRVLKKPLPAPIADALFDAAQAVTALATAGVAHRVTGPLSAALQWWTLTYRNSFGMILHNDNMMLTQWAVLGCGPSADALSVDALVRDGSLRPEKYSRDYGAVVTGVNISAVAVYFISGVAKVRSPYGWKWAGGRALKEQIAADAVRKDVFGSHKPKAGEVFYRGGGKFAPFAVAALGVELASPLALADKRLGYLFAVSAWAMHMGIRVVMGIKFTYNLSGISYLGFFPWGKQLDLEK